MVKIHQARPTDAQAILNYTKIVGSETNNLSFGPEGLPMTLDQETKFLERMSNSTKGLMLIAKDDEEIVGLSHFALAEQPRMSHRGEIGMSIRKDHWGQGIASEMMELLIEYAKKISKAQLISLEVRSDNQPAIHLYQKFGFEKIGTFPNYINIAGEQIDCDIMVLKL